MGKVYISNMEFMNNINLYDSIDIKIGSDANHIHYQNTIKYNTDLIHDLPIYIDQLLHTIYPDNKPYYCAIRINTIEYSTPWYVVKENHQKTIWYFKPIDKSNFRKGKYPYKVNVYDVDNNLIISQSFSKGDKYFYNNYDPVKDINFNNFVDIFDFKTVYDNIGNTTYIDGLSSCKNSKLYFTTRLNTKTNIWYGSKLEYNTPVEFPSYNAIDINICVDNLKSNKFMLYINPFNLTISRKTIIINNDIIIPLTNNIFSITLFNNDNKCDIYLNYKYITTIDTQLIGNNITGYISNINKEESSVGIDWIRYYEI